MSKDFPQKLTIKHLRGSVQPFSLSFEKDKNLTIIYGENGTGKSTICDAFEFLGRGNVGSIENRGLGKKVKNYWPSIGKNQTDVEVTLESSKTTCCATLGKSEVVFSPPEARPQIEVLRRTQILSLIEGQAADRYAAISKFIDVSAIEASEKSLSDLINQIEKEREIAIARVQENRDAIQKFWEAADRPGTDPIKWAEVESTKDSTSFSSEIGSLDKLQKAFERLQDTPDELSKAEKAFQVVSDSLTTSKLQLAEKLTKVSTDASAALKLLQAANDYFSQNKNPSACPLCESAENISNLVENVTKKLESFADLQAIQAKVITQEKAVNNAQQAISGVIENSKERAVLFENCCKDSSLPADTVFPDASLPEKVSNWNDWFSRNLQLFESWKKAENERTDKKQFLSTLREAVKTCNEHTTAQLELDKILPQLKSALAVVKKERHRFTDDTLSKIANEVGRLYELVHPGEGLNKISLQLDPKKRASLEIGADFCGYSTPPQAYFSESHLDTLGICVFLALAALESPENAILVLDDVLASVDEPHVERLILMLYEEAKKFRHCIITTHYKPWKQKFRWGWLKNGQCHFVELTRWSAANGLTLHRSIPDLERLRQLLNESSPDPQLVCAKAGVILEAALDFLTLLYECSIPRRPGGAYTLGDLLPAINKNLRTSLKVEIHQGISDSGEVLYETVFLSTYLDKLSQIAQARNVFGCHFNQISFELLEDDAIEFGQQVLELMETLTDENIGWPRNDKSGSYWATSGETRRLHPLKKPS